MPLLGALIIWIMAPKINLPAIPAVAPLTIRDTSSPYLCPVRMNRIRSSVAAHVAEGAAELVAITPRRQSAPPSIADAQAVALARELRHDVRGEVRFDRGSRALYATDASNYRQVPIGVVIPRDADDVVATIAACRRHDAPVLPRGGGTSLAGQCCNVAVVIDMSKYMNRIVELDLAGARARVQPGLIHEDLRDAAISPSVLIPRRTTGAR
jgi:hypothetical protein